MKINCFQVSKWQVILILWIFFHCHALLANSKLENPAPLFKDVGSFHHPIKTKSTLAQRYFDQGLIFLYSFEYGESIRSFRAATQIDPTCAMCFWGLALALGSKTDMPINGNELVEAKSAIKSAEKYVDPQNLSERLYIAALAKRYSAPNTTNPEPFAGLCSSYSPVMGENVLNYANAMKEVTVVLPKDPDAKTLYIWALIDKIQWNFWNHQKPSSPATLQIVKLLESVMQANPYHPGANHLYVHIIEGSSYPEKALAIARRLGELVPISEHMHHMPAHTYYSLGLYHDAVLANQKAIAVYKKYVAETKAQGFEPEIQYLYYHNIDYLSHAASMEGNRMLGISSANSLAKEIEPLIKQNFLLQKMLTPAILMPARFGEWNTLLNLPTPNPKYQYVTGIWHYAQGLAEVKNKHLEAAKKHLKALNNIVKNGASAANLFQPGFTLLQIAYNTLNSVIEGSEENNDSMIASLQSAVKLQDEIDSFDPPPWYFPVRELLGQAFLKIGKAREAKQVFLEDLKKHPQNPWSLYGLSESERALGNTLAANKTKNEFKKAWKYADIKNPIYPIYP